MSFSMKGTLQNQDCNTKESTQNYKYCSWKRGLERLLLSLWIKMLRFFSWKVPIILSVSHSVNDRGEVRKTPGQQHQWHSDKAALYWVRKASYLSHTAFLVQTRSYTHWNYGSWYSSSLLSQYGLSPYLFYLLTGVENLRSVEDQALETKPQVTFMQWNLYFSSSNISRDV